MDRSHSTQPKLSDKQTRDARLWRAFASHPTERNHEALWNHYQPLVRYIVAGINEKLHGGVELVELLDAANVGLLDAIADYTPEPTAPFEPFAVPLIRASIHRSLAVQRARENAHLLRLELADAIAASPEREASNSESLVFVAPMRERANAR